MANHVPAFVVTDTVIEEVVPANAVTPSKVQRFVRGQVVSSAQIEAYKERTGVDIPVTDVPDGIAGLRLGMMVALTEDDATPPPAVAPHVEPGSVIAPGVTSEVVPAEVAEPEADLSTETVEAPAEPEADES